MDWATFGAGFLAAAAEAIEAVALLVVVAAARGLRPVAAGTAAALAALALVAATLGAALHVIPERALHLVVGLLLTLFAARWLRKAVLRAGGGTARKVRAVPDDEDALGAVGAVIAALTAFKAVLLEGLEVVFVVLAVGGGSAFGTAAVGAAAGFVLVLLLGAALRAPLARLPRNAVTFWAGATLMGFGTYWVAQGLGGAWPADEAAIVYLAAFYAGLGGIMIRRLSASRAAAA